MAVPGDGIPAPAWDRTVADLGGGVLQSRAWGLLQARLGRSVYYDAGHNWAWLGYIRQGRGVRYLCVPYGPVARTQAALGGAMSSLTEAGRALGVDFVRCEPVGPVSGELMKAHGARPMAEFQPRRTLILDLSPDEAELRSGIAQSNRNLINTAPRRCLRFQAVTRPDATAIDQFVAMLRDTVGHTAFIPYDDDYYRQTIAILSAEHTATLYQAYAGDALVAGAVVFDFNGTRYYAHAAAFQDLNRQHKAAVPLLWQLIVDAKHQGAHTFDFWGIAPTDDPSHPWAGFTRFKRSFGGQVKEYGGTWDLPVRALKYTTYRLVKDGLGILNPH